MGAGESRHGGPGRWWGWGDATRKAGLPAGARAMLASELGEAEARPAVAIERLDVPAAGGLPEPVIACAGEANVHVDAGERVRHAAGKSYPDLVRLRSGELDGLPDAVIVPADGDTVAALLGACSEAGVAVVPFGGGTSVVGGVDPVRGEHERVVALDLRRLRDVSVDRVSMTATLGAGLRGPEAEAALAAEGLTLGHFPQSFEYATIGGFAATRSAGQASTGYGRFDELVASIEMETPIGPMRTLASPHTAAGPALRELILGSEGTLGVITQVSARVRLAPARRRHEAWVVGDFSTGREIMRALAQAGVAPDVARLSDESETRISLALAGTSPRRRRLLDAYLALRRRSLGCLMIVGWEGTEIEVARRRALSAKVLREGGAAGLGEGPGRSWERGRFEGPYLRDELIDLGYLVETLETSHTWSRLERLYRAVGSAIEGAMSAQGTPGIVMCHVSHVYRDGASLYFTFACRARPGREIEQWRAIKEAACGAIVAEQGTITHHHAVGRDHAPYMRAEVGEVGLEALAALKGRLDPAGVMNPGKLLVAGPAPSRAA